MAADEQVEDDSAAGRTAAVLAGRGRGQVDRTATAAFDGGAPGSVVVIASRAWAASSLPPIQADAVQVTVIEA